MKLGISPITGTIYCGKTKKQYRVCPYCNRHIPSDYNFSEHKRICKSVDSTFRMKIEKKKKN